jgi:protein-arginine kinase activator protein McsA
MRVRIENANDQKQEIIQLRQEYNEIFLPEKYEKAQEIKQQNEFNSLKQKYDNDIKTEKMIQRMKK